MTALEKDTLKEIFNIGVSKAADAFSQLMQNRKAILLTVPDIKVIEPNEFPVELTRYSETVLAVKSRIEGELNGLTVLLFSDAHIDWIMLLCLTEVQRHDNEAAHLRMSFLLEISNILTGAILTQFSNLLELEVAGLPPVSLASQKGNSLEGIFSDVPSGLPIVLSVKTDLVDDNQVIEIPLLIFLEHDALATILDSIRKEGGHELLQKIHG